ncbi:hypothetical protein RRG08_062068 [Elysia crispata]|uniref:Chitin-binding type-2 domain-containing protein n=1 Tax=Elysia crispata TaxID=231223 RepID=A0AAE1DGI9_9GAST|nr:hypothetical protein RRG08_062068 [Elysia crispata]
MKSNCIYSTIALVLMCSITARGGSHDVLTLCADNGWADGIYPHPTVCTMFIECSGRVTSELDCPANLVFNPNLNVCDDPNNVVNGVNCAKTSTTSTSTQTMTTTTARPTTTRPATTASSTTVTTTPTTTSSTTTPTITTTTTAPTTTSTTTAPTTTLTTTAPTTTSTTTRSTTISSRTTAAATPSTIDITNLCVDQSLKNGIHPDPTSCGHFIECSFGQTYRLPCPANLAFNTKALTCDDKFNVDCRNNYNSIIG